jgi:hypothetical protein
MVLPGKVAVKCGACAIRRTRAQRAHLTVTLRGERMPGTEDGPGPVLQARPSAQRYGGGRRPAEAGQPDLAAAAPRRLSRNARMWSGGW